MGFLRGVGDLQIERAAKRHEAVDDVLARAGEDPEGAVVVGVEGFGIGAREGGFADAALS